MEITLELLPSRRWAVKCGSRAGGGEVTTEPGVELEAVLENIVGPMVERATTVLRSPQPSVTPPSIEQLLPPGPEIKRRRIQILERLPEIIEAQREQGIALGVEDKRRRAAEAEQSKLQENIAAAGSMERVR
jgi:hypothetical protein